MTKALSSEWKYNDTKAEGIYEAQAMAASRGNDTWKPQDQTAEVIYAVQSTPKPQPQP